MPRFGLKTAFIGFVLVALGIQGIRGILSHLYPKTKFVGSVVSLETSKQVSGIDVWIRDIGGSIPTDEERLELGLLSSHEQFEKKLDERSETPEEVTKGFYSPGYPLLPKLVQPGLGAQARATTDGSGRYVFPDLKRHRRYLIWIDDPKGVTPAVEVLAEKNIQSVDPNPLASGGVIQFQLVDITTGKPTTIPLVLRSIGPASPDYLWPFNAAVRDGMATIRLPKGINRVWFADLPIDMPRANYGYYIAVKNDGEEQQVEFAYIPIEHRLYPVFRNPDNDHLYVAISKEMTWQDACEFAKQLTFKGRTGHVVTVNDKNEQDFLVESFRTFKGWMSLSRDETGNWQWNDGTNFGLEEWAKSPLHWFNLDDFIYVAWTRDGWTSETGTKKLGCIIEFSSEVMPVDADEN